ncbi:serine/threonine protein kinase [Pendulispora albinea]|uniref:Serine/threonine protein kinase n=1 Tax=Pendulispora albinea TaxID=2741071 RepID=A0ABZ2LRA6_9BACT
MSESAASEQMIGKYRLIADLEHGGMGNVYIAIAEGPSSFSKVVVLKELKPEFSRDHDFVAMFYEEARVALRLHHPNIIHTYEVGREGDHHFIAMEYLSGQALSRILQLRYLGFSLNMYLRVLCEVLRALEYAHSLTDLDGTPMALIHRDVNPDNVFVTYDGQIKLLDFGIAKARNSRLKTRVGVLKGKPRYMAPEQVTGEMTVRTDFFAVGVMIWEAVTGHSMWYQKTDTEILSMLAQGRLPSLRLEMPRAPSDLARICDKACAVRPEDRYASAVEFLDDLEGYLRRSPDPVMVRDVSARISEMFAEERAERREMLGNHLGAIRTSAPPVSTVLRAARFTPRENAVDSKPRMRLRMLPSGTAATELAPSVLPPRRPWLRILAFTVALALAYVLVRPYVTANVSLEPVPAPVKAPLAKAPPAVKSPPPSAAPAVSASASASGQTPASASTSASASTPTSSPPSVKNTAAAAVPARPHRPPAKPQRAPASSPASASSAPVSCDPPFYFEGTKKTYKPECI